MAAGRNEERMLESQLAQIATLLHKKKDVADIHIEIHKLVLEDFRLEDLTFRLDSLDIKDLSGTLNLGNNFGGGVQKVRREKQGKEEAVIVRVSGNVVPHRWS
ncbi:hypothetical protein [Alteribacter natronophilus]|uniref:hypothetical protein n=1 Tax=Alteribacter natronophilus TaxID=2583810 RepID=UPI001486DD3B|nr:hypothetical protein [Alteribacter natronophilus]